ncbi:hypothetical protein DFH11DRAFT_537959 [Phellopilus nigrolimitatus]|nr:hypothetical protein DFH11DRAFT_537959 [Phellopilus nigrolimitatus]
MRPRCFLRTISMFLLKLVQRFPGSASNEQPDPFRADASNYYNAAAGFPNSPPKMAHVRSDSGVSKASTKSTRSVSGVSHHSTKSHASSKASRNSISGLRSQEEEDLILSLRTQLAYHQELTSQYEIDLSTRDEIVSLLNRKLKAYEEDSEKRTKVMRGMRRKVQELERACRGLEEQVDQSRQDSFERSVMDEASGDALRDLHRQINQLEKDKSDVEKREQEVREENEWLKVEMQKKEDVERNLEGAIEEAKKQVEIMRAADQTLDKGMGDVRLMMVKSEQEYAQEAERHHDIEVAWAEERARLVGQLEEMEALRKQLSAKESEVDVLKREVEAQWTNTEKLTEKTEELQKEKDDMEREREHLKNEITSFEARTSDMEVEWTESENRRGEVEAELADVWQSREEVEKERDQVRNKVDCLVSRTYVSNFLISSAMKSSVSVHVLKKFGPRSRA